MVGEAPRRLDVDPELFGRHFDREAFTFEHRLANDPRFAWDALVDLVRYLSRDPENVYFDAGDVAIGQRWADVPDSGMTINDVMRDIESASGWILLRRADRVPEYAALMDEVLEEIEHLSGRDLRPLVAKRRALIFINSPHRVSSYHIDRECNWLLQIRGTKTVNVFRRDDREVLPETEIERFWTVDNNAAVFKPELQERATVYELRPGSAVHLPVNAPHWVKNGPEVSVSLSINFHYHETHLANVYKTNYWLRRMGLRPTPPGVSPRVDALKRSAFSAASAVRGMLRSRPRKEYY